MGSLGTGYHVIEICLDDILAAWVMLHYGSCGPGNVSGWYLIDRAKKEMMGHSVDPPDKDLAYLLEGTDHFDVYIEAPNWVQKYALENRPAMMDIVLVVLRKHLLRFQIGDVAVNCHHNTAVPGNHFGADD